MLKRCSRLRRDILSDPIIDFHLPSRLVPQRDSDYLRVEESENDDLSLPEDDDYSPSWMTAMFDEREDEIEIEPPPLFPSFNCQNFVTPGQLRNPSVRHVGCSPGSPLPFVGADFPPSAPPPFPLRPPIPIPPSRERIGYDADGDVDMATDGAQEPRCHEISLRAMIIGDCAPPPPPLPPSPPPPPPPPELDFQGSVSPFKLSRHGTTDCDWILEYNGRDQARNPMLRVPTVSPKPLQDVLQSLRWLGPRTSALGRNTNRANNPVRFLMRRVDWNGHLRLVRVALFSRCGHNAYYCQLPMSDTDPRLELFDVRVKIEEFFQMMQADEFGRQLLVPLAKKDRKTVGFKPGCTSYFGPLRRNAHRLVGNVRRDPNPSLSFHPIDQIHGVHRLRFKLNGADIRQTGRKKRLVYRMGLIWFRAGVPVFYDQIFFQMKKDSIPTERKQGVIRSPVFTWASPRYDEGLGDLQ